MIKSGSPRGLVDASQMHKVACEAQNCLLVPREWPGLNQSSQQMSLNVPGHPVLRNWHHEPDQAPVLLSLVLQRFWFLKIWIYQIPTCTFFMCVLKTTSLLSFRVAAPRVVELPFASVTWISVRTTDPTDVKLPSFTTQCAVIWPLTVQQSQWKSRNLLCSISEAPNPHAQLFFAYKTVITAHLALLPFFARISKIGCRTSSNGVGFRATFHTVIQCGLI